MNRDELIARLAGYPARFHTAVAPLADEERLWRPGEGEWSINEVLGHVRDAAELLGERVQRIATEEHPYLPEFKEAELAVERNYQEDITPLVLARYVEHRTATVELLRGLPVEAWGRTGEHWNKGRVTLEETARGIADHDEEHLGHVRRLRAAQGS